MYLFFTLTLLHMKRTIHRLVQNSSLKITCFDSKAIKALTKMNEILLPILREHDVVGLKDDDSLGVLDGVHFMELVRT